MRLIRFTTVRSVADTLAIVALLAAAAALVAPAPARAAAQVSGYVWASQPGVAAYVAATGYEDNSASGAIDITRTGVGEYQVRFRLMAATGGVAHAWAYGSGNGGYCAVVNWVPVGPDEAVRVRCFDGYGAPADMRYTVTFTNRQLGAGTFVYLWSNLAVPPGPYVPNPAYSYDSTGGPLVGKRTALGHYTIYSNAVANLFAGGYYGAHFRATAYGNGPARCAVMEPLPGPPVTIEIICFTVGDYVLVDTRFTFSAGQGVNVLGDAPAQHGSAVVWPNPVPPPTVKGWSSPGGAPTATEFFEGVYEVSFPGLGAKRGLATVNAFGIVPFYCNVAFWYSTVAGDEVIRVECWDPPPDVELVVGYFAVAFTV